MTEEQIIKLDLNTAKWIGEEGGMAVSGSLTKAQALKQMKALMRQDVGKQEASELTEDKLETGYFRIATEQEKQETGSDWYAQPEQTPYELWVYWG